MERNNKHTAGLMEFDGANGTLINNKGTVIAMIPCSKQENSASYTDASLANAKRFVKCWNSHDKLVEALREAKKELRLLNVNSEGEQKQNTPASLVIHKIEEAINQATQ